METTSRYQALLSLQQQKGDLIKEKDSFPEKLKAMRDEIKNIRRNLEDREEQYKEYESRVNAKIENIDALILAVEEGIKQFTSLSHQTKN